jgi:DNA replication protein DnaC
MSFESTKDLLQRIKEKYPHLNNIKPMSPQEAAQAKADSYNSAEGDRHLIDGYNCEICRNKGYIAVIRERKDIRDNDVYEEILTPCKCDKIRKSIMRMKRSGLEEMFKKYRFENYVTEEQWQKSIKDQAMKFAKNPKPVFFIGGQSGCGKTHLCTAIARDLLLAGNELRYILWRDESVKLKSAINDEVKYQSIIEGLKKVEVLYIDDFLKVPIGQDASKPTSADLALALEIINNRYNAKLTTIISSEWNLFDIIGFDEALGGRIYEMAGEENCKNIKKDKTRNYRTKGISEL